MKKEPLSLAMSKLILVVSFIVGIGAVLGVAGYVLTKQKCAVQNPPVAQKADETADWKTYRNEEYGFEVKYPINWENNNIDPVIMNLSSNSSFRVSENNNDNKLSLNEWIEKSSIIEGRGTLMATAKLTEINGIKAYKLESELNPPNLIFDVIVASEDYRIFSLYVESNNFNDNEILNQILSTFKFTEK